MVLASIAFSQGITTYEYVVAMRAMSEAPGGSVDEELPTVLYSPSGSATTGYSGGSSIGLQYKGAWCTPPRVFVDYQVRLMFVATINIFTVCNGVSVLCVLV